MNEKDFAPTSSVTLVLHQRLPPVFSGMGLRLSGAPRRGVMKIIPNLMREMERGNMNLRVRLILLLSRIIRIGPFAVLALIAPCTVHRSPASVSASAKGCKKDALTSRFFWLSFSSSYQKTYYASRIFIRQLVTSHQSHGRSSVPAGDP